MGLGDGGEVGEGIERWDVGYPNRPGTSGNTFGHLAIPT
jgi:hypothetical protein